MKNFRPLLIGTAIALFTSGSAAIASDDIEQFLADNAPSAALIAAIGLFIERSNNAKIEANKALLTGYQQNIDEIQQQLTESRADSRAARVEYERLIQERNQALDRMRGEIRQLTADLNDRQSRYLNLQLHSERQSLEIRSLNGAIGELQAQLETAERLLERVDRE